jgi:glypican 6
MPEIMKDGILNQVNNPEVEIDVTKPNSLINQQILQLRLVTSRLKNAYNGLDVDWIDTGNYFNFL